MSVLIGTIAQFHCAGTGIAITWEVDGLASSNSNITSRGISSDVVSSSSGTVQSNLTVPATSVNNGTTVQCRLFSSSGSSYSNNSTLTVLPGELCESSLASKPLPFLGREEGLERFVYICVCMALSKSGTTNQIAILET